MFLVSNMTIVVLTQLIKMKNDWRKLLNQMFFVDDVRNSLGIIYIYLFPFSVRWTYLCTFESDHHNRKPFKTAPPPTPPTTSNPRFHQSSHPIVFSSIEVHRICTHYLSLVDFFKYFEVSIPRYFHLLFSYVSGRIFLALSFLGGFPYYCSTAYYSRYEEMSLLSEFLWETE